MATKLMGMEMVLEMLVTTAPSTPMLGKKIRMKIF